jgi:hypothetical protein
MTEPRIVAMGGDGVTCPAKPTILKHGARSESESHAIERRKPSRGSPGWVTVQGHPARR